MADESHRLRVVESLARVARHPGALPYVQANGSFGHVPVSQLATAVELSALAASGAAAIVALDAAVAAAAAAHVAAADPHEGYVREAVVTALALAFLAAATNDEQKPYLPAQVGRHPFSYPAMGEVWERYGAAIVGLLSPTLGELSGAPHFEEQGRSWPGGVIYRRQTGSAGTLHVGIYSADATTGRPDELLWSFTEGMALNGTKEVLWSQGVFTAAGAAYQDGNGDLALAVGDLVWKAMLVTGTTAQFNAMSTANAKPLGYAGYAVAPICFLRAGQAALPAAWGDTSAEISSSSYPVLGLLGE